MLVYQCCNGEYNMDISTFLLTFGCFSMVVAVVSGIVVAVGYGLLLFCLIAVKNLNLYPSSNQEMVCRTYKEELEYTASHVPLLNIVQCWSLPLAMSFTFS